MAIEVYELSTSGGGSVGFRNPNASRQFAAIVPPGTSEDARAPVVLAVEAEITLLYAGLLILSIDPEPRGGGFWFVSVSFGVPEYDTTKDAIDPSATPTEDTTGENDPLGLEYSCEISGGTQHITQSLKTKGVYNAASSPTPAMKFRGAIGVTRDGVTGTDKFVPQMEIPITVYYKFLSLALIKQWRDCFACTNLNEWRTFAAGELLYLGCSLGKFVPGKGWPATHKIGVGKNQTDIVLSRKPDGTPDLQVDQKNAWDVLWCYYDETADPTDPTMAGIQRPRHAYVEQIYEEADFLSLLLI